MAYISKEEVKNIRQNLKKEFPQIKFSVVTQNYSTVQVSIMESKEKDFSVLTNEDNYTQLNPYNGIEDNHPLSKDIDKMIEIMKGENWYDKSDSMTDYFDTAYYLNLHIGKWDKPYQFKGEVK